MTHIGVICSLHPKKKNNSDLAVHYYCICKMLSQAIYIVAYEMKIHSSLVYCSGCFNVVRNY